MPTYDYRCNACEHVFEAFHLMSEDNPPAKEPCPECGKKKVTKAVSKPAGLGADTNLTPDKVTGGDWSEMMGRIKGGIPKRYHAKLDKSTNMTGRKWNT
jgi:putative FmdB family regulatory protein